MTRVIMQHKNYVGHWTQIPIFYYILSGRVNIAIWSEY